MKHSRNDSIDFNNEVDEFSDGVHLQGRPFEWNDMEFKEDVFGSDDLSKQHEYEKCRLSCARRWVIFAAFVLFGLVATATFVGIQATSSEKTHQASSTSEGNDADNTNADILFIFPSFSPSARDFEIILTSKPSSFYASPSLVPVRFSDKPTQLQPHIPTIYPTKSSSMKPTSKNIHNNPSFEPSSEQTLEPTFTFHQTFSPAMMTWYEIMLNIFNNARIEVGSPTLCWNQKLIQAAEVHVQDMFENNFLGSTGSDGSSPKERAESFGYSVYEIGQTVLSGYSNVSDAVDGLFSNEDLKSYILYEGYIHIGVARRGNYWVQLLAISDDLLENCTILND